MDKQKYLLNFLFLLFVIAAGGASAGVLDALDKIGSSLGATREFLDPEEAFKFSHAVNADGQLQLQWEIEPGYYLYRDKISARTTIEGVAVGELKRPVGIMKDDPEFGQVSIYKHAAQVVVPVAIKAGAADPAGLEISYQGCAEDGICYPPIKKAINVLAAAFVPAAAAATAKPVPTNQPTELLSADDIAAHLATRSLLGVAGTFYVFGLLLAFTPCVFPMVPILSGIIVGQQQPISVRKGLTLSAVYVLAVALTYAMVGLAAGMFGHNLQATFQHPAVLIGFALVFVALAMSMFGFYELQLPSAVQTRLDRYSRSQDGGSLVGVAIMGVLSAIIVGPCVAPPLAGALIYLGHQGSPLTGGTALFAMGLGMGTPLLLVGASAGQLLPRAGAWMDVVKRVFGVLLLGVAIWFLERIVPGPLSLSLWAVLLIVSAIYMGALDNLSVDASWRRLSKGVGLAMLCYGAVLIIGASAGADDPLRPLKPLAGRGGAGHASTPLPFAAIKGIEGLEAGLARARQQGRPVMLDFYADWCVECKYLERDTFEDKAVRTALADVILLRADVTANDDQDQTLLKRLELFGPPAVLFFDPSGNEYRRHRLLGFVGPDDFTAHFASLR